MIRSTVGTSPFQGENPGSIPGGNAKIIAEQSIHGSVNRRINYSGATGEERVLI